MGEPFADLLERIASLEPFHHEYEYRVTYQDGDEEFVGGHFIVREFDPQTVVDKSAPEN